MFFFSLKIKTMLSEKSVAKTIVRNSVFLWLFEGWASHAGNALHRLSLSFRS
jgi:hypothetical protein